MRSTRSAGDATDGRRTGASQGLSRAAQSMFPVVAALEALDAWLRAPSPDGRTWLGEAVAGVVRAAGARGAYLAIAAPPLPGFAVGFGTLAAPPEDGGNPRIRRFELTADQGKVALGTLWLDTADPDGAMAVRALELALDAAWSRASVHQTAQRLEALDGATRAIAGVLALDRVLQLIVDRVRDLVGARYAALGIVDMYGRIERFITSGISREERERIGSPPRGRGVLGLIIREGRPVRLPDISAHEASFGFPHDHPRMRSFLGVPVTVKGRTIGDLYLADKLEAPEFSENDERLVEMFAVHAGIAIENARLHEQVQRLVIVEERERIGRDLHDGVIQSLYAVALSLEDVPDLMSESPDEAVARVDRAIDSLNVTIRDIRNFIFGLRPELLDQSDLVGSLAALTDEIRVNTLIDLDPTFEATAAARLPAEARTEIVQIAREALSNVARHSRATRATVELRLEGDHVTLIVTDNGAGFDPYAERAGTHQGLPNMRERAEALGGSLTIDSEPGSGTRIIVRMPTAGGSSGVGL